MPMRTVLTKAKVSVGSVLQSGDQFLTLVPLNAPLEVDAMVAGNDAGFVHVGNKVAIKFDTFPFTHYGEAKGTVSGGQPGQLRRPAGREPGAARRAEPGSCQRDGEPTRSELLPGEDFDRLERPA